MASNDSGGEHNDSAQDHEERIAESVESQPGTSRAVRAVKGALRALVLAVEVQPPESGGDGQTQDGRQNETRAQIASG